MILGILPVTKSLHMYGISVTHDVVYAGAKDKSINQFIF